MGSDKKVSRCDKGRHAIAITSPLGTSLSRRKHATLLPFLFFKEISLPHLPRCTFALQAIPVAVNTIT
jgi:hypothetical protein